MSDSDRAFDDWLPDDETLRVHARRSRWLRFSILVGTIVCGVGILAGLKQAGATGSGPIIGVLAAAAVLGIWLQSRLGRFWLLVRIDADRIQVEPESPTLIDRSPFETEWSRVRAFKVDRAAGLSDRESLTLWTDDGRYQIAHDRDNEGDDFNRAVRQIESHVARLNESLGEGSHGMDIGQIRRKPGLTESNTGLVLAILGIAFSVLALLGLTTAGLPQRNGSVNWRGTFKTVVFVVACAVFAVQVFRARRARSERP